MQWLPSSSFLATVSFLGNSGPFLPRCTSYSLTLFVLCWETPYHNPHGSLPHFWLIWWSSLQCPNFQRHGQRLVTQSTPTSLHCHSLYYDRICGNSSWQRADVSVQIHVQVGCLYILYWSEISSNENHGELLKSHPFGKETAVKSQHLPSSRRPPVTSCAIVSFTDSTAAESLEKPSALGDTSLAQSQARSLSQVYTIPYAPCMAYMVTLGAYWW